MTETANTPDYYVIKDRVTGLYFQGWLKGVPQYTPDIKFSFYYTLEEVESTLDYVRETIGDGFTMELV